MEKIPLINPEEFEIAAEIADLIASKLKSKGEKLRGSMPFGVTKELIARDISGERFNHLLDLVVKLLDRKGLIQLEDDVDFVALRNAQEEENVRIANRFAHLTEPENETEFNPNDPINKRDASKNEKFHENRTD